MVKSVSSHVQVFDCPAWHNQTTLVFKVLAARRCPLDDLLCKLPILEMYALERHIQGWFLGLVVFENAIGLVRPNDLSIGGIPPEAAGVTESLAFGEISFAAPDSFFCDFTLRNIHDGADNFFDACVVPNAVCKVMKILD